MGSATVRSPVIVVHSCAPSSVDEIGPGQGRGGGGGNWAETTQNWAATSDIKSPGQTGPLCFTGNY